MTSTGVLTMADPAGVSGSLGTYTRVLRPGAVNDPETPARAGAGDIPKNGDLAAVGLPRVAWVPRGVDLAKFDKSDLALFRRALRWQRLRAVQFILDGERVAKCFRVRYKPLVEVHHSRSVGRAHYGALVTCASVWMCPVCAAKITERRRAELEGAATYDFAQFMVTLTLQHAKHDRLADLYRDLSEGLRALKAGRWWQSFAKGLQIVGSVMGTEITVSDVHGWHPHKHALYLSRLKQKDIDVKSIQAELSYQFEKVMKRRGRYVSPIFGVNVQAGEDLKAAYIAKMGEGEKDTTWSLAAELTKSPVKSGRGAEHFHPFELPDLYMAGNRYAGQLFREYAFAMKGKNQLSYSPGTRELLGLGVEVTDEEIANAQEKDAYLFALLSPDDWRLVLQREKRGQILEVASTGDYKSFVAYMRVIGAHDFGKA